MGVNKASLTDQLDVYVDHDMEELMFRRDARMRQVY